MHKIKGINCEVLGGSAVCIYSLNINLLSFVWNLRIFSGSYSRSLILELDIRSLSSLIM